MTTSKTLRRAGTLTGGIGAIVVAGSLAVATTVFACTEIMGPLTVTPNSGPAGSAVSTSATGLKGTPAKYEIHFAVKAGTQFDCMSFKGVQVLKTIKANRTGGWKNVAVTIPSTATMGVHAFCGMEIYPVKGGTGTTHQTFTVT